MYGDLLVMIAVAAFMITIGVLPSVAIGAAASASGVRPNPVRKSTFSVTTSSCASRLETSPAMPVLSRYRTSTLRPATVSPCCFMYVLMPPWICLATSANGPDSDRITPSLSVPPPLPSSPAFLPHDTAPTSATAVTAARRKAG